MLSHDRINCQRGSSNQHIIIVNIFFGTVQQLFKVESGENPGAPGTVKLREEKISQIHASRIAMHLPAPECME